MTRDAPAILRRCAGGELPANVALAQIAGAAATAAEVDAALQDATRQVAADPAAAARLDAARRLWAATPGAWALLRGVLACAGDMAPAADPAAAIAAWSRRFDAAAALSAEASVALYSLGRPELLAAATAEIVALLETHGLLGRERVMVEIGCGNGRCLAALAGRLGFAIGIDIAPAMLAQARRRCAAAAVGGVGLLRGSGRDLAALADGCADLVLAVDAFPYLVAAGEAVAAHHVADARRILAPGGALVILNYAYDRDPAAERAAVTSLARANGLTLAMNGARPFQHWDGRAFLLTRRDRRMATLRPRGTGPP